MRISDWSSDVCSSDLSAKGKTCTAFTKPCACGSSVAALFAAATRATFGLIGRLTRTRRTGGFGAGAMAGAATGAGAFGDATFCADVGAVARAIADTARMNFLGVTQGRSAREQRDWERGASGGAGRRWRAGGMGGVGLGDGSWG